MNFERRPAPSAHFNQSPSLVRRLDAKKDKERKKKYLLISKIVLVILGSGFLAYVVYRNFGTGAATGVSNDQPIEQQTQNIQQISTPSESDYTGPSFIDSSIPVQGMSSTTSSSNLESPSASNIEPSLVSIIESTTASNSEPSLASNSEPLNDSSSFNQDATLPLDPHSSTPPSPLETSNDPSNPSGHDLILLSSSNAIFSINPTDQELIANRLINLEYRSSSLFFLSNDKTRIYFVDGLSFKFFNLNDSSLGHVSPTNWDNSTHILRLKTTEANSIIYRTGLRGRPAEFSHYSLDESRLIFTYKHNCPWYTLPILLEQANDGTKILYSCYPGGDVFIKDLNYSDEGHRKLFVLPGFQEAILCPDQVTLIMYGYGVDYWVIKNLANPNVAYESKKIRFNVDISTFRYRSFSFSNDGRTLYAPIEIEIESYAYEYRLFEIDIQSLLENDYSKEDAPYVLGQGRPITIAQ